MIYYRRYVSDYQKKTMRLNPTDHGVYDLMLDYCYMEEAPLPLDIEEICSICKATQPEHRASVTKVLRLYFILQADGYHNIRADEEIKVAQRARENGKQHTGKGTQTGTQTATQSGTHEASGSTHPSNLPTFQPSNLPTDQPFSLSTEKALSGKVPDDTKRSRKKNGHDFKQTACGVLDFLNAKAGKHFEHVDANIELVTARLKSGVSVDDLRSVVVRKCREWNGTEYAKYLRPATLFNRTKFAQYQGELVNADDSRE